MSAAELVATVIEHDPVRRWREGQLELGGYPPYVALVLSGRPDVDIHRAVDLLSNGCPLETALQMLI